MKKMPIWKPIWKNAVLITAAFVVIIAATFSWFYTGRTATGEGYALDVGEARYVQISGDGGNKWGESLELEIGFNNKFKEISGDGTNFFAPVYDFMETESGSYTVELVSFNSVNGSDFCYEQVIDFRTDSEQQIYLSSESAVSALGDGNGFIDGAIRIAFFELDENGNEILKYIWAPNSAVEYSAETDSFVRNGSVEPYYYYQKSLNPVDLNGLAQSTEDITVISTELTDENGCGYSEENCFMWSNGNTLPAEAPMLLSLDKLGEDKHFHNTLKIRVWLEGYDRECVGALSGQRFTLKLEFDARRETDDE